MKHELMTLAERIVPAEVADEIISLVEQEEKILYTLKEDIISERYNVQNRNIKMLLGHLVDSASNNHQRIVRLQYAPRCGWSMPDANVGMLVFPDYTQDNDLWISLMPRNWTTTGLTIKATDALWRKWPKGMSNISISTLARYMG